MRKLISSINVTLDGYCDHTAGIADDELHQDANELFKNADTAIFGRVTYQLMESSWPTIIKNPTGNKPIDEFAVLIDGITKVVFSRTLQKVEWNNTILAKGDIDEEVKKLKQQPGKNILVGSPSLIIQLMNLGLIDEYFFWVHPVILGDGLPLFKNIKDQVELELVRTRVHGSGRVTLVYRPLN